MNDVADRAQVSLSTVSYALSGKRKISPKTKARIDEAIASLGFSVHAGARALASAHTMVIALLIEFNDHEFAPTSYQYAMAICRAARESGYDTLLVHEDDGMSALARVLATGMADGVILLDIVEHDPRVALLHESDIPSVLIGIPGNTGSSDAVDLDFFAAGRLTVSYSADFGHTDILVITPPEEIFDRGSTYAHKFREGAIEEAARLNVRLAYEYGASDGRDVADVARRILYSHPRSTALIVHNDATAAVLPRLLAEVDLQAAPPKFVVGMYSAEFSQAFSLPFPLTDSAPDVVGAEAVSLLVSRIARDAGAAPCVRLVAPARPSSVGSEESSSN